MTSLQKGLIAAGVVVVAGVIVGASVLSSPKPKGEEVYMAKAATKDACLRRHRPCTPALLIDFTEPPFMSLCEGV